MHKFRTHNCGELTEKNIGETVLLSGWLQNIRDIGSLLFFTIRDQYGVTQAVVSDDTLRSKLIEIPRESTISVKGTVNKRQDINPNMPTGYIEVIPEEITLLGKSANVLPFEVSVSTETREDIRLKYRFLDLRNERVHQNIVFRSKIIQYIRNKMVEMGFLEIQTPILTSSSPEGARDFIVPSRLHPGQFYALPQAPQQFKQLLMVSGFDKYFQVAPCFRDEDPRADRSPGEFYQLDIEMSFATQDDVFETIEGLMYNTFTNFSDYTVTQFPFQRIPYKEAISKYGSDKPDLRNPLILNDVTNIFSSTEFKAFQGNTIIAIALPNSATQPRKFFDKLTAFATESGAKGLAWVKLNEDMTLSGSIAKFITETEKNALISELKCVSGHSILFIAGKQSEVYKLAGLIRNEAAAKLNIIESNTYKFCWIVDFPMYEYDTELEKIEFSHNPFSMPQHGMEDLLGDPLDVLAFQYDLVCNGYELASGAVRNHSPEIMVKAFDIAGYSADVVESKFPALYNAFHYGPPPHAGIAPGLDRIVMLLANEPNIREVIAFPKNKQAQDLLMGAPSEVSEKQLKDVLIKIEAKQ